MRLLSNRSVDCRCNRADRMHCYANSFTNSCAHCCTNTLAYSSTNAASVRLSKIK